MRIALRLFHYATPPFSGGVSFRTISARQPAAAQVVVTGARLFADRAQVIVERRGCGEAAA